MFYYLILRMARMFFLNFKCNYLFTCVFHTPFVPKIRTKNWGAHITLIISVDSENHVDEILLGFQPGKFIEFHPLPMLGKPSILYLTNIFPMYVRKVILLRMAMMLCLVFLSIVGFNRGQTSLLC